MSTPIRVCLLGFSTFEHGALASALRLDTRHTPTYLPVTSIEACELAVVDADRAEALAEVVRAGRVDRAVYIGSVVPQGSSGWLARPIDTVQLMRKLDRLVARELPQPSEETRPPQVVSSGANPAVPAAPPAPDAAGQPSVALARALLVDDSEIALRFLETRLHRLGVHTDLAGTSGKALDMLAQHVYDVAFLDVELGSDSELDGLALCQQIKRHGLRPPGTAAPVVIMISAHHAEIDRARAALAGCDAYLGKPLDEDLLHRILRRHGVLAPDAPISR